MLTFQGVGAAEYRYALGGGGGTASLSGGDFFKFDSGKSYGFALGHRLSSGWQLDLDYSSFTLTNDENAELTDSVSGLYNNSPLEFQASRLNLLFNRKLFGASRMKRPISRQPN
jgi:hypothetical protein